MGDESSFQAHYLPDGKTTIDAFLLVFDISRGIPRQSENAINLIQMATKLKKNIFIVASKYDEMKKNPEGLSEIQKILRRKECKNVNPNIVGFRSKLIE